MKAKTKTAAATNVGKPSIPDATKVRILTKVGKIMADVASAESKAQYALENSGQFLLACCVDVTQMYAGDWNDELLDECAKVTREKLGGVKSWSKGTVEARTSEVRTVLSEHAGIAALAPRIKKMPHDRTFIVKLARGLKYGKKPGEALKDATAAQTANKPGKGEKVSARVRFYKAAAILLRRAYKSKAFNAEDKAKMVAAFKALGLTGKIDSVKRKAK